MHKESYRGVKYYSGADLAKGYMLEKAIEVYGLLEKNNNIDNINVIIELYNINKYVKDGTFQIFVGKDREPWLNEKNKIANFIVGNFLNQHTDILIEYENVDFIYKSDYWEIVANKKVKDILENRFQNFINDQESFLIQIFSHSKLVRQFDNILRAHMLNYPVESTQLILNKYLIIQLVEKNKPTLPQSLTLLDKENIINEYLDTNSPNLNYTRLLCNVQSSAEFTLDARIKLKAKRVSEKLEKEFFKGNSKFTTEFIVAFKENLDEVVTHEFTLERVGTIVDLNWLKTNIDNPTLLNNFIYIFQYVNEQMVSNFPYNELFAGVLERFGFSHEKEYRTSVAFSMNETLSLYQLNAYYSFLKNNDKDLETIIEWFFNDYLHEEFDIKGFNIKLPPAANPNFEKCKSIFPTIESIIKKYKFYLEDGHIDEDLVQIESKPLLFSECPSKTQSRYVYIHDDNIEAVIAKNILFSDQSDLTYFPSCGGKEYNNLFERLSQDKLYIENIENYQKQSVDWLSEQGYVKINKDNRIVLDNENRTYLYYLIYLNGVIVPSKLPNLLRKEVDRLIELNLLVSKNTLLTKQEAEYFDYYLNKSSFINGYDLRNKYLHGTSSSYNNENEHYTNYLHALRLLITIMIKINDDLCTASDEKQV